MKWLLFTEVFVTVLYLTTAHDPVSESYGSCASIGYNTSCCPASLGTRCQAVDAYGYFLCGCDASCHNYGDCCEDVYCTPEPRTCADVGITSCCHDKNGSGLCDVHYRDVDNSYCSCNLSCHLRNDCCSDATRIGCVPQTCTEAGKDPGCCVFSNSNFCFVQKIDRTFCYCDSSCVIFDDCCDDVVHSVAEQCVNSMLARSRIQSQREHTIESSTIRRYNENERRTRIQNQVNFREAQTARVPRPRARMNRIRARPSSGYRRRPVH